ARTLDVGGRSRAAPTESLRSYLVDRDLLLVIDNCEHVIDASARLASSLLSACANLRILATSRESLGVTGETVWRLDSLEPEAGHRLFLERARQREPEFIPDAAADARSPRCVSGSTVCRSRSNSRRRGSGPCRRWLCH